ncbi:helix-turn-helix domain-containing protein [Actinokineospora iranica]|uniref:Helix-turn-helix domain-containing protein n=1 Tax=Actinokineospora iranica TaxID=1271860 RepID=A0A1G6Y9Y1_9PSEU|nr:helix-turn-helix domain-containing protein [Actinokineospora iranica]SDD86385.1 Helix-turn-helix domain-containing protein [Actinokineospora iranica]
MPRNLITVADRARVRELHAEGKTRNDIARAINRSPSTVTGIARSLGLSFDRSATAAATTARQIDNRARRAEIVGRLYGRAEHLLARLEAPAYTFTATTINGIESTSLDHVPAPDEKALASALSTHLSAAGRLEAVDADKGSESAKSMLGGLAVALGIRVAGDA